MNAITPASTPDSDELLRAFEEKVEHHHVSNEGVGIHYAATGTGPLIVFLHGFPDHWLGWWMLMADLQADYRVVAIDLRGYNLSDKPVDPQAYEISRLVGDVRAVIAHEGATLSDVVRITTYLEDTRDFGRYNKAFLEGIGDAVLARTTVEAKAVINTKIEMDAIVYKPLPAGK